MAQSKNHLNAKNTKKKSNSSLFVVLVIASFAIAIFALASLNKNLNDSSPSKNASKMATAKDSDLVIQLSDITEQATFYPVEVGGTKLEVLAVKASDGTVRTAFNTCQVCYSSGRGYYVQDGNVLVCQNCGNRFSMSQVGVTKGGCNPVPIMSENKTVDETSITISKNFLEEAAAIFANWKS